MFIDLDAKVLSVDRNFPSKANSARNSVTLRLQSLLSTSKTNWKVALLKRYFTSANSEIGFLESETLKYNRLPRHYFSVTDSLCNSSL